MTFKTFNAEELECLKKTDKRTDKGVKILKCKILNVLLFSSGSMMHLLTTFHSFY